MGQLNKSTTGSAKFSFKNFGKVSEEKTHKISYSEKEKTLHKMYADVAAMRTSKIDKKRVEFILNELKTNFKNDWLLPLEMYELMHKTDSISTLKIHEYLLQLKDNEQCTKLIEQGLQLINKKNQ